MNDITMKCTFLLAVLIGLSLGACSAHDSEKVVYNGIPWFDEQGNIVNAHGACIVEDGGRYYLFGEYKSDKSNPFRDSVATLPMIWLTGNLKEWCCRCNPMVYWVLTV